MAVWTGLDVLVDEGAARLKGRRVGLVCNPAAVTRHFESAVDAFVRLGVDLRVLFGPEHGIRGEAQDMIPVDAGGAVGHIDPVLGIPVFSLYGDSFESLFPTPAMLRDIDVLVVDLQDVGSRYYTFYATLYYCMQVCARCGVEVLVLDRPNPLGGGVVEGGVHQSDRFLSFVGPFPIPVRHGLTLGELGRWAWMELGVDCAFDVVPMRGWRRSMYWNDTGLSFLPPSPNMPTADTALVYPGGCLVEATNLSEARGTTRPFEQSGAPWLDPERWAADLRALELPGVIFRPMYYRPTFHKHAGRNCGAVFLHVTDRDTFLPYRTGVELLRTAHRQDPQSFAWRTEPYEFVSDPPAIDLLTGSDAVRRCIEADESLDDLATSWALDEQEFCRRRDPVLLYREV